MIPVSIEEYESWENADVCYWCNFHTMETETLEK